MAAYYVAYSRKIGHKHLAAWKSNVTLFLVCGAIFSFILPLIFSYNSKGFWIKHSSYFEQPVMKFKYEYLLILEYHHKEVPGTILCTSSPVLSGSRFSSNHCTLFKALEKDFDRDGKNDRLELEIELSNVTNLNINTVNLFMVFDYKIYQVCIINTDVMIAIMKQFQQPIGGLNIASKIKLGLTNPMNCNVKPMNKSNATLLPKEKQYLYKTEQVEKTLSHYRSRAMQIHLENPHYIMSSKSEIAENEPFILKLDIHYNEHLVIYKTKFWQLMKWAWVQYFSLLVLFLYCYKKVKKFVFQNRILQTIRTSEEDEHH